MKPLSGGTATTLGNVGPNQFERRTVGSTTQTNGALVVNPDKTGTTSTYYRRDDDGQLVSLRVGTTGSPHYYGFDGVGSVSVLSDTAGAKSRSYSYDPYGNTTDNGGTSPANPWCYAGTYALSAGTESP
jgi:hypothetical protein